MPDPEHHSRQVTQVACAVVTVSDTRTSETDTSGQYIKDALSHSGHRVVAYDILPDEPERLRAHLRHLLDGGACQAILLSGGTGLAPRDTTYEVVAALLHKRLDGFGELFRSLSFAEIGPAAMLSRAVAGTVGHALLFSMPGSTPAVRLAMDRLILPTLGHTVALLARKLMGRSETT